MEEEWTEYDGGAVQECHRNASHIRVASGVAVIPENAFRGCDNLQAVDLSNVSTISNDAFRSCEALERVIRTTASVEIGERAFAFCKELKGIDLSNATKIGKEAFYNCKALTSVSIPSSVAEIEDGTFMLCKSLVEVELSEGLQHIGVIGRGAFQSCHSLERITIPSSVAFVNPQAFGGCSNLTELTLREGVHCLEDFAFSNCSNLSEVTLREGIQCIGEGAFYNCTSLDHINIPPVALVIDIERSSCQLLRNTMPKPDGGRMRKLVVSKWMQYWSPSQLERAESKVNEILRRRHQTEGQKVALIREWFAYVHRLDVTSMLELAIWRVNMDDNAQDAEARQASRQNCGSDMSVIVPCVLPFLEG